MGSIWMRRLPGRSQIRKRSRVNAQGVYLAGVIVAGTHTNEIFIENGRFHG